MGIGFLIAALFLVSLCAALLLVIGTITEEEDTRSAISTTVLVLVVGVILMTGTLVSFEIRVPEDPGTCIEVHPYKVCYLEDKD